MTNVNLVIGPVISVAAAGITAFAGGTVLIVLAAFLLAGPIATVLFALVPFTKHGPADDPKSPALGIAAQNSENGLKP